MKLLDVYRAVLRYCGLDADDQGYISLVVDDKREPAMIEGLRMVLPTDHHQRSFNPQEKIIFHPLTENILREASEVIQKLKHIVNVRLNVAIGIVGQSLLNLVASPAMHKKLSPEQAELLLVIKDADEKSVTNFISLMVNGIRSNPERLFTNIYLKRGGTYREKRYSRVGIVTFPFYVNLLDDKIEKIRVKDKETYHQLFNYIFPNLEDPEEYNFGSDSNVAPYLEALLRTSANIASRLNDIIQLYKDYIDDAERLMFDAEWMEYFQDLNALIPEIRKVPTQHGSEGTVITKEEPVALAATAMAQQSPSAPAYTQAPAGLQAPAMRPEVKQTKRGLDFKSLMQSSPSLAMVPNPLATQVMNPWQQQQMAEAQRMPSWAMPQMPPPPQGAQQGPNGQFYMMTQNGPVPIQLVPTPQGPQWQMMAPQMPMMMPSAPMMTPTTPPWGPQPGLPAPGYGYPR